MIAERLLACMPVIQVREGAAAAGVLLGGENALPCFVPGGVDQYALDRIVYNTKPWSPPLQVRHQTFLLACCRSPLVFELCIGWQVTSEKVC